MSGETSIIDIAGVPTPISTAISAAITTALAEVGGGPAFPVGSLFFAAVATDPAELLGYGTWAKWGEGRVFVCQKDGDADFANLGAEGGAKTHTLTEAQIPAHTHVLTQLRDATTGGATTNIALTADTSSTLGTKVTGSTGGGQAHPILMPFKVGYCWERTA